jgi:hypothetical protein
MFLYTGSLEGEPHSVSRNVRNNTKRVLDNLIYKNIFLYGRIKYHSTVRFFKPMYIKM